MKLFHQRPIDVCMVFFVFLFPVHHSIYAQAAIDSANVISSISQNGLTIANAKPASWFCSIWMKYYLSVSSR
jgi:hypothetical protein